MERKKVIRKQIPKKDLEEKPREIDFEGNLTRSIYEKALYAKQNTKYQQRYLG
jgi:hypothetical protein